LLFSEDGVISVSKRTISPFEDRFNILPISTEINAQVTLKLKDEMQKLIKSLRELRPFSDRIEVTHTRSKEQDYRDQDIKCGNESKT
jgi:hypothetical protein